MTNGELIEQLSKYPKDAIVNLSVCYTAGTKHKMDKFKNGKYNMYTWYEKEDNSVLIGADD